MKLRTTYVPIALTLALLAAVALSQEAEKELAPKPDVKALIQKLGSADFAERKKAEEDILSLGEKALPALQAAAKGHEDAHVRYEAERLMHRLALMSEPQAEKELAEKPARDPFAETERQMNELLKQLEERGMMDWEAFERWRENMRRQFGQKSRGLVGGVKSGISDNGRERIEYEQSQDGSLKIKITREGVTEEFAAKSLDELKETQPEVYKLVGPLLGSVRIEWGPMPDSLLRRLPRPAGGAPRPRPGVRPGLPVTPQAAFRLGVWTGEVSAPLRAHLKLPQGVGVLVEDVVPGSFAAQIGLEAFDVIRTVQGEKVGCAEDIRKVVGSVAQGEQVLLDIIRKGEPLKLMRNR
jgi:hypothetical protein